jgi:hypothetical protein
MVRKVEHASFFHFSTSLGVAFPLLDFGPNHKRLKGMIYRQLDSQGLARGGNQ